MARTYRVICAQTEGGVLFLANRDGWQVLQPVREFSGIDSEDDGTFSGFGGFMTTSDGYVALCYKEIR